MGTGVLPVRCAPVLPSVERAGRSFPCEEFQCDIAFPFFIMRAPDFAGRAVPEEGDVGESVDAVAGLDDGRV